METEGFITYYPTFKESCSPGAGAHGDCCLSPVVPLPWLTASLGCSELSWGDTRFPQEADYEMETNVRGSIRKLLGSKPWREREESGLGRS